MGIADRGEPSAGQEEQGRHGREEAGKEREGFRQGWPPRVLGTGERAALQAPGFATRHIRESERVRFRDSGIFATSRRRPLCRIRFPDSGSWMSASRMPTASSASSRWRRIAKKRENGQRAGEKDSSRKSEITSTLRCGDRLLALAQGFSDVGPPASLQSREEARYSGPRRRAVRVRHHVSQASLKRP